MISTFLEMHLASELHRYQVTAYLSFRGFHATKFSLFEKSFFILSLCSYYLVIDTTCYLTVQSYLSYTAENRNTSGKTESFTIYTYVM